MLSNLLRETTVKVLPHQGFVAEVFVCKVQSGSNHASCDIKTNALANALAAPNSCVVKNAYRKIKRKCILTTPYFCDALGLLHTFASNWFAERDLDQSEGRIALGGVHLGFMVRTGDLVAEHMRLGIAEGLNRSLVVPNL